MLPTGTTAPPPHHTRHYVQCNVCRVGQTAGRIIYSFGTLQAHLQNKCVITKYDYGHRVPTIFHYARARSCSVLYRTPPPPSPHTSRMDCVPFPRRPHIIIYDYIYYYLGITIMAVLVFVVDIRPSEISQNNNDIIITALYPRQWLR